MARVGYLMLTLAMIMGLLGAGCQVPVPPEDLTPPDVTMDVYGIPLPQNAGAGDEEMTVNVQCCDVRRSPPPARQLDFVAAGRDGEGVRRTRILVDLSIVCTHTVLHDHLVLGTNAEPMTTSQSSPSGSRPAQAPTQRIAQGRFRLGDHLVENPCPNFNVVQRLIAEAWAEAENYHGAVATTKVLELDWP
jgi:hypothetical protein